MSSEQVKNMPKSKHDSQTVIQPVSPEENRRYIELRRKHSGSRGKKRQKTDKKPNEQDSGVAKVPKKAKVVPKAQNSPLNPQELRQLAFERACYWESQKDWLKAAEAYLEADVRGRAAKCYDAAGEFSRAGQLYEKIERWAAAGYTYRRAGLLESAARCFEKAVHWSQAARCHREVGQWVRAGLCYERANLPHEAYFCYRRGDAFAGEPRELEYLRAKYGLASSPWPQPSSPSNANAFERIGKPQLAIEAYEKAEQFASAAKLCESRGQHKRAAINYAKAGDFARAAPHYELSSDWIQAGWCHRRNQAWRDAARCYLQGKDLMQAGECLEKQAEFAQAGKLFERARAWVRAAEAFEKAHWYRQAATNFQRAGRADEARRLTERNAGRVAAKKKKPKRAIQRKSVISMRHDEGSGFNQKMSLLDPRYGLDS